MRQPLFAAFDDVDPPRRVTAVAVVVAGEKVAVLVKGQLLRVAQAGVDDLQLAAVGVAAEDRAAVDAVNLPAVDGLLDVEPAVAHAEIELAVGTEDQAVQVVTYVGVAHAVPVVQHLGGIGIVTAVTVDVL